MPTDGHVITGIEGVGLGVPACFFCTLPILCGGIWVSFCRTDGSAVELIIHKACRPRYN